MKEPILKKQSQTEIADTLPTEIIPEIVVEVATSKVPSSSSLAELAASMMDEEPEGREAKRGEELEVREDKRGEEIEVREDKRGEEIEVREDKRGEEQEVREDKRGEEKGREDEKEEEVTDLDFLDKSILATAVASSIFLEVSEPEEEDEKDAGQDSAKDVEQGPSENGENEALFTWLRSVSDIEVEPDQETTESVQPSLDLIEKFIATEPRITPGKVEQYTGVSFAKDSLEENFDWVTETMAKLYATQGKIDRARKAYKRLIELHPEKKIHFENQLKALNQRK